MEEYINIGKIVATFGISGELIIKHALQKKALFKKDIPVFIEEMKGAYIPYFTESSKAKNETESYIKFEGINSKEAAHKFIKKNVWLLEKDFRKMAGKNSFISLLHFDLFAGKEKLGIIEKVFEQPHQVLLQVTINYKEALIPLHEETLEKIDHAKKQVYVVLPEGLLDIYK